MNKRTAATGVAWNMGFAVLAKLFFPIVGILIARKVGIEAVGDFAVAQTIFAVIELLREGGLGATYLADPNVDEAKERLYAGAAIASGAVFALVLFSVKGVLAKFFNSAGLEPALAWASLCTFASALITIPSNRLQREARFRDLGLADVGATAVSYGVALGLAIMHFGFASLVAQMVIRVLLFSAGVTRFSKFIAPNLGREGLSLLRSSFSNLASNLAYFVYTSFDYFVVKKLLGSEANGAYYCAFNIGSKPVDILTVPVTRTVFVAYAKATEPGKHADYWTRAVGMLALVTMPLYALMGFHGQAIIDILYGDKFAAAGPALRLLAIYLGFRAFGAAAGSALVATGHARLNALAWIPGYAIAITGIWLCHEHPTLPAIVASLTAGAVAVYVTNLVTVYWAVRPDRAQMAALTRRAMGGVATSALVAACALLPITGWQQLTAALLIGVPVHFVLMGIVLAGDWKSLFSVEGIKRVGKAA